MPTVETASTPYCSASILVQLIDPDILGDYLSSNGQRLTKAEVVASTTLNNMLLEASGMIEAASLKGNRYKPADLALLTGASKSFLEGIVAGLVLFIMGRRKSLMGSKDSLQNLSLYTQFSLEQLEMIAKGDRIFSFTETAEAGLVENNTMTASEIERRDTMVVQAAAFFGTRGNELR